MAPDPLLRPLPHCAVLLALAASLRAQDPIVLERPGDPPALTAQRTTSPRGNVTFGVYTSVQVNVDGAGLNIVGDAANEPSIGIDPTNPARMVIGWRQFDSISSSFREAGVAYSHDAGQTWTFPGVIQNGTFRSDPVLDADSQGNFYYLSLKTSPNFTCDVFVSGDGGVSWNGPFAARGGDKSWFIVDQTGSAGAGNLYQAWNIAGNIYFPNIFSRSVNGGTTWSSPVSIPDLPVFGSLDVSADGTLYVSGTPGQNFSRIAVSKSTNAKTGTASPSFTTSDVDLGGSVSLGAGPNPSGLLGQIWVAVDRSSGATKDNVYMLASVNPAGPDPMDVYFVRSEDGGSNWSAPYRVNDDATGSNRWQWFGTMSVAPNGRVDVVWCDTRASNQARLSELYYAYTMDGGAIWSENIQVSPSFDSHVGWPNQNKLGDYYHMRSDAEGGHLAYAATFNGEQDVYYLNLFPDCNGNGRSDTSDLAGGTSQDANGNGVPDECELVFTQDPLVRGTNAELRASGFLAPGETVYFAYSTTGTGTGPCIFNGNLCVDLLGPILIGAATVASDGTASLTQNVPSSAPLVTIYSQAVLERGAGGAESIKSNVVVDTIQ